MHMWRVHRAALGAGLAAVLISAAVAPAPAAAPKPAEAQNAPAAPVDLNTATPDALQAIPGIGEVIAGRIVKWREEHGPFHQVDDLMKVQGIGEKLLEKLRPYVRVGK